MCVEKKKIQPFHSNKYTHLGLYVHVSVSSGLPQVSTELSHWNYEPKCLSIPQGIAYFHFREQLLSLVYPLPQLHEMEQFLVMFSFNVGVGSRDITNVLLIWVV